MEDSTESLCRTGHLEGLDLPFAFRISFYQYLSSYLVIMCMNYRKQSITATVKGGKYSVKFYCMVVMVSIHRNGTAIQLFGSTSKAASYTKFISTSSANQRRESNCVKGDNDKLLLTVSTQKRNNNYCGCC